MGTLPEDDPFVPEGDELFETPAAPKAPENDEGSRFRREFVAFLEELREAGRVLQVEVLKDVPQADVSFVFNPLNPDNTCCRILITFVDGVVRYDRTEHGTWNHSTQEFAVQKVVEGSTLELTSQINRLLEEFIVARREGVGINPFVRNAWSDAPLDALAEVRARAVRGFLCSLNTGGRQQFEDGGGRPSLVSLEPLGYDECLACLSALEEAGEISGYQHRPEDGGYDAAENPVILVTLPQSPQGVEIALSFTDGLLQVISDEHQHQEERTELLEQLLYFREWRNHSPLPRLNPFLEETRLLSQLSRLVVRALSKLLLPEEGESSEGLGSLLGSFQNLEITDAHGVLEMLLRGNFATVIERAVRELLGEMDTASGMNKPLSLKHVQPPAPGRSGSIHEGPVGC